ncbi:MFS transporter (plasmid) [Burkholderia sp. SFA1]|nr:MFS transporter [Burkholderia sp. SFA1]
MQIPDSASAPFGCVGSSPGTGRKWTSGSDVPVGQVFEDLPLTSEHWKACFTLFVTFVIEAWEMMIIVYASPHVAKDFSLNASAIGNLIGSIFLGMAIGSVIWTVVCDRIGRKATVISSLALYGIASGVSVIAPDYGWLYSLRLLSGIAAAGMLVVTFPYFEELLPVRSRGRLTVYLASGWPLGILCAIGATVWLTPYGWRAMLAVSSAASLWLVFVAFFVPESPYWLAGVGRQDEAKAVIRRLSKGRLQLPEAVRLVVDSHERASWKGLLSKRFLRITVLQIAINFTFSWGYWGIQSWLPVLLQKKGLDLPQSYAFIAISALCMVPGYIAASFLTGRIGRKLTVVLFIGAAAVAGYAFAFADSMKVVYASNFALAFFSLGAWGVWDTWVAELYPTSLRTVGYGWMIFAQRIANIVAPSTIGALLAAGSSFTVTTTMINAFMVASVILAFFLPETEGRDLV